MKGYDEFGSDTITFILFFRNLHAVMGEFRWGLACIYSLRASPVTNLT